MIKVAVLKKTCDACPAQWEGRTDEGKYVYVRYRWGYLSVGIGDTFDDSIFRNDVYCERVGDPLDGTMDEYRLRELTKGLIEWPA